MAISHHSHSGQFCLHANGTLEQVVQTAIAKGFTTFGLTEHVPRSRVQDLYPEEADLTPEDLTTTFASYLAEAQRLQIHYSAQITLLIGLETESIHPLTLDELEFLLSDPSSPIQYLVGSIHHVSETPIDFDQRTYHTLLSSLPAPTSETRLILLFSSYFDAQYDLLVRFKPEVIGHFDLCRLYDPDQQFKKYPQVWAKVERNVKQAIGYGALFEINASAFRKGWKTPYPGRDVFELIQSLGGRFTLSDDSHGPQAVGLHYDQTYSYLVEMGLQELWHLAPAPVGSADSNVSRGVVARQIEGRPWEKEWRDLLQRA
ncbi:histidinol-phosphatase (PHP family) [Microbotryum lychnidis-dioicae p1A1 Lamole]|uniref:Histidinol-phosphatase n=1 Tax=Microbotryum lychnidis-dioicae (strain p1A1 Lamole / MvSl-1064) TaxID=683840 RepID=U5GZA1_USTV1|nr:histidinol-phosphatase (PHP family) [Microbotryum lychnidis-dioicae p1A1 Lamole]|eukprot:KDE09183.1 histidinol-phosphatase (PHP family) [Microbotryum lychnidis-dioicae p1A1 Lamole]